MTSQTPEIPPDTMRRLEARWASEARINDRARVPELLRGERRPLSSLGFLFVDPLSPQALEQGWTDAQIFALERAELLAYAEAAKPGSTRGLEERLPAGLLPAVWCRPDGVEVGGYNAGVIAQVAEVLGAKLCAPGPVDASCAGGRSGRGGGRT
jgi:hypothetical protein